jgi:predicted HicB family RNase H-like nuclease
MLVVVRGDPRVSLNLRVAPEIKQQVEAYAQRAGISTNAAASVLLADALRAERRKR